MLKKIKDKKGSATIVELLICFPLIAIILFLPVGFYQKAQQLTYIEDIKTSLLQETSRDGDLTTQEINNKWKSKFEQMKGITVQSISTVNNKVYRDDPNPIVVDLVFETKPAIFSGLLKSNYKTKIVVYSEYIG